VVFPHRESHILLDSPDAITLPVEDIIGHKEAEVYETILYCDGGFLSIF
jgi:hypothetical protein